MKWPVEAQFGRAILTIFGHIGRGQSPRKLCFMSLPRIVYVLLVLMLACAVFVVNGIFPWPFGYDIWLTAAAIKEVALFPDAMLDPVLPMPVDGSPRIVPYAVGWGWFMRFTGFEVFTVVGLAGAVNVLLLGLGLYLFCKNWYHNGLLALWALPAMMLVWGTGFGWANAYHLELYLMIAAYVGSFSFSTSLIALALLANFIKRGSRVGLLGYGLLAMLVFVSHPITGAFLFVGAAAMLLSFHRYKQLLLLQLVPLAVLLLSMLWPYYNMWDVLTGGTSEAWFISGLFKRQFGALGLLLLGFVPAVWLALNRGDWLPLFGAVLCGLVYGIAFLLEVRIGGRFVLYGAFFLHLALARGAKELLLEGGSLVKKPALRWGGLAAVVLLLGTGIAERVQGFQTHYSEARLPNGNGPVMELMFVQGELHRGDVLLADPTVAWAIPAITDAKVVAASKIDPIRFADNEVRKADVATFLADETPLDQLLEIIKRYGATHLLLRNNDNMQRERLLNHADVQAYTDQYLLLRLQPPGR